MINNGLLLDTFVVYEGLIEQEPFLLAGLTDRKNCSVDSNSEIVVKPKICELEIADLVGLMSPESRRYFFEKCNPSFIHLILHKLKETDVSLAVEILAVKLAFYSKTPLGIENIDFKNAIVSLRRAFEEHEQLRPYISGILVEYGYQTSGV